MISPLDRNYKIDGQAVERIIDTFVTADCAPFVLGTTGEAASLSGTQKLDLVKKTVAAVNGRTPVFAGISGTSLYESIEAAKAYQDLGVDVMVTTLPYYYPITATEMTRFFEQLADAIRCPLILYNMPATVGHSIPLEVADHLSEHPHIVGMKDSERDVARIDNSLRLWRERGDFGFYQGWAAQSAHALMHGAEGIVPGTANFAPGLYKTLYDATVSGNREEALHLQSLTDDLSLIYQRDRKLNTSLPALKALMDSLGLCAPYVMPPMYKTGQDESSALKAELRRMLKKIGEKALIR